MNKNEYSQYTFFADIHFKTETMSHQAKTPKEKAGKCDCYLLQFPADKQFLYSSW